MSNSSKHWQFNTNTKRKTTNNWINNNELTCQVKIWQLGASWTPTLPGCFACTGRGTAAWGCWRILGSRGGRGTGWTRRRRSLPPGRGFSRSCLVTLWGTAGRGLRVQSWRRSWALPWQLLMPRSTSCWCPWGRSVAAAGPCTCTLWRARRSPGSPATGQGTCRSSCIFLLRWSIWTCPLKSRPVTRKS